MSPPPSPPSDLDHNREGRLSPAQAAIVASMRYSNLLATVAVPLLALNVLGVVTTVSAKASPWAGVAVFLVAGAACVAVSAWAVRRSRARAAARAAGVPVRAVEGHVAWSDTGWAAYEDAPGGPRPLAPVLLPPGPFRVYLHDDQLVGAESRLGPGSYSITQSLSLASPSLRLVPTSVTTMTPLPVGDRAALARALARAGQFTPDDLTHHRRGRLSPRQGTGAVVRVEGQAQLRWSMPTKITVLTSLDVAGVSVPIARELASVVVPGLSYRIYRAADDGRVVGLEAIDPPRARG
jgi:hypothetical protein